MGPRAPFPQRFRLWKKDVPNAHGKSCQNRATCSFGMTDLTRSGAVSSTCIIPVLTKLSGAAVHVSLRGWDATPEQGWPGTGGTRFKTSWCASISLFLAPFDQGNLQYALSHT
mmetsp:Transcript_39872/g.64292  ORF Transcript_39872/g.64292 Transcript_39872/m.64292 type:complete len:113 (+) Transcript_39872:56-394(+)